MDTVNTNYWNYYFANQMSLYYYTTVHQPVLVFLQVLKQCPKDLQSDICIHLNRKVLYNNSAFRSMPMSVMRTIARNFCICHVAPGDRVVHEGENLDVLYFVSHGSFEVKQDGRVAGLLGKTFSIFERERCSIQLRLLTRRCSSNSVSNSCDWLVGGV